MALATLIAVEDAQSRVIETMIANYEKIEADKTAFIDSLNEPSLYPEVRLITNKCIDEISLVLDQLWKEIMDCQAAHMKTINENRARIAKVIKIKT